MTQLLTKALLISTLLLANVVTANQKYAIYLDADFNTAQASSIAIYQGINTALAEVNYQIQGHTFEIITKDHGANPLTSRDNLNSYIKDDKALVVFSGLHSPPLLSNKSFINNHQILLLDPWAAAVSITRSNSQSNWIFRLSIDDKSAGQFIAETVHNKGFNKPHLLLEDTEWGHTNFANINQALKNYNVDTAGVTWFNWDLELEQAIKVVNSVDATNADSVIYIGNAAEAKVLAQATLATKRAFTLPVYSHWGITGGDFYEFISQISDHGLDLTFIQTNFAFTNKNISAFANKVLANAIKYNKDINHRKDIKAPAGFIHAYDMTKILIAAINQAGLKGDKKHDKQAIHFALENLAQPVQGLIKTYHKPFSTYSLDNPDAHEALNRSDYAFGKYNEKGEIVLIQTIKKD